MTPSLDERLERLASATREIEAAVAQEDAEAVAIAVERRQASIDELALVLAASPRPGVAELAIQEIVASDRRVREWLEAGVHAVRRELDGVRNVRRSVGRQAAGRAPARFVCERI